MALVLGIAVCLGLGTYLRQSLQPALHPLILSRQADASPVRSVDESATYRNVNAPIGFDLAMRPQRGAPDVPALVHEAIGGEQARRLLDATLSNADLLQAAAELARGVGALLAGDKAPEADDPILLTVYGPLSSSRALVALLAGAGVGAGNKGVPKLQLCITHEGAAEPPAFDAPARANAVVCTDASARPPTALMHDARLLVTGDNAEAATLRSALGGAGARVVAWPDVLGAAPPAPPPAPPATVLRATELDAIGQRTFGAFWDSARAQWLFATQTSLTSGVTVLLSEYPPELIPGPQDRILVDTDATGAASPVLAALLLTATYTGASVSTVRGRELLAALRTERPTLLYLGAPASLALAHALVKDAEQHPLHSWGARRQLVALRQGILPARGLSDRWTAAPVRERAGVQSVRGAMVLDTGAQVGQALLDTLRVQLAAPVMHAYIPRTLSPEGAPEGAAGVTAPVCATHMYDLQAFADHSVSEERVLPAQVGPTSVATELKLLFDTPAAHSQDEALRVLRTSAYGSAGNDPCGEVCLRGYTVVSARLQSLRGLTADFVGSEWMATGDVGTVRPNGTLVVLAGHTDKAPGARRAAPTTRPLRLPDM